MKKLFIRNVMLMLSAFIVVCMAGVLSVHATHGVKTVKSVKQSDEAWKGKDDLAEPKLKDDVYQISSGAELAWFAKKINESMASTLKAVLVKDIDLGNQLWTPIGDKMRSEFKGEFDGNGKTVSGLKIETDQTSWALFGHVTSGTVKNLTVSGTVKNTNGIPSGKSVVAGIVGSLSGRKNQPALIKNCISNVNVTGGNKVGGIVGTTSGAGASELGRIENCASYGNLDAIGNIGGIVGSVESPITVTDSYNRGNTSASGFNVGGIVGYMSHTKAKVANCYTTGSVSGKSAHSVIGKKEGGTVDNCYYLSSLTADTNAAAISEEDLKAMKFSAPITSFVKAPSGVNDGFPIFEFQKPAEEPGADLDGLNKAIEQATDCNDELLKNDAYKDVSDKLKAEIEKAQAIAGSGIKASEQNKVDAAAAELNAAVENAKKEKEKIDAKIADDAEKARLMAETEKLLNQAKENVNNAMEKVKATKSAKDKASRIAEEAKEAKANTDISKEALRIATDESAGAVKAYESAEKNLSDAQKLNEELILIANAVKDSENAAAAKIKADEAASKAVSIKEKIEAVDGFVEEVGTASANAEKAFGEYKAGEEKHNKAEEEKAKEEARKKAEAEKAAAEKEAKRKAAEKAQKKAAEQAAKKVADEKKAKDAKEKVPSDEVAEKAAESQGVVRIVDVKVKGDVKKGTLTLMFKAGNSDTNYRVAFRENRSSEWKYIWTGGLSKTTIRSMRKNGLYEVKVAAYRNKEGVWTRSAWSDTKNVFYAGTKAKLKGERRSFAVNATKVTGASGVTVKYSPKKNMRKVKHRKFTASALKKNKLVKIKKLRKNSRYFVTVAPFKNYKGKIYYGLESKVKKVRSK